MSLKGTTVVNDKGAKIVHDNALSKKNREREKHLFYFNNVAASLILEMKNIILECPSCKSEYRITYDMFLEAKGKL